MLCCFNTPAYCSRTPTHRTKIRTDGKNTPTHAFCTLGITTLYHAVVCVYRTLSLGRGSSSSIPPRPQTGNGSSNSTIHPTPVCCGVREWRSFTGETVSQSVSESVVVVQLVCAPPVCRRLLGAPHCTRREKGKGTPLRHRTAWPIRCGGPVRFCPLLCFGCVWCVPLFAFGSPSSTSASS